MLNGQETKLPEYATYDDVIIAAGGNPQYMYTVTYADDFHGRDGILLPKQCVRLGRRTIFNVADTNKT